MTAFGETVNADNPSFRVDNPELTYTPGRVQALLIDQVQPLRFRRQDFHDKIGRTLCSSVRQDICVLVENDDQIWLKHVVLVEVHVEGSVVQLSDRVGLKIAMKFELEIARNILVKTVRIRRNLKVSLNKLIPRPGLWQGPVIVDRQKRNLRIHRHRAKGIPGSRNEQIRTSSQVARKQE